MGVINEDPMTTGFGINNLTFSFTNLTNSVRLKEFVLTDGAGPALGSLATLASKVDVANRPDDLLITVNGDTLTNGGAYSPVGAAASIPAALPLLAGGIALLGFVGRRRQRNALRDKRVPVFFNGSRDRCRGPVSLVPVAPSRAIRAP